MPKNWQVYKHEIESLYLTQGRTLEEVRKILKERHNFEASTRAYRMKLDEWQLWKNKSNRFNRISYSHSETSRTPERVMEDFPGLGIRSSPSTQDGDDVHGALSPMSTSGPSMTEAGSSPSSPYWRMLLAKWRAGGDLHQQAKTILEQDGTSTSVFKYAPDLKYAQSNQLNLFDEICSNVGRFEDLAFAKAFILACFESNSPNQTLSWNLSLGLNAYGQRDWRQFKEYLFTLSDLSRYLRTCMSGRASNLVLDAIFFLVGERLLTDHRAYLESCHRWPPADFNAEDYDFHRKEYVAILKDFRDRRRHLGMPSSWEEFLLDLMEKPVVPNGVGHFITAASVASDSERAESGGPPT